MYLIQMIVYDGTVSLQLCIIGDDIKLSNLPPGCLYSLTETQERRGSVTTYYVTGMRLSGRVKSC